MEAEAEAEAVEAALKSTASTSLEQTNVASDRFARETRDCLCLETRSKKRFWNSIPIKQINGYLFNFVILYIPSFISFFLTRENQGNDRQTIGY